MSTTFLENLLDALKKITHCERGLAVDENFELVKAINLADNEIQSDAFNEFASQCLQDAVDLGEPVLANNIITDLSEAPETNTNFSDLRVIIALPVKGHGAIYLDQHIGRGVIPKQMLDRLMALIEELLQYGDLEGQTPDTMVKRYQQKA